MTDAQTAPSYPMTHSRAVEYNLTRNIADRVLRVLEKQLKPRVQKRVSPLFYAWPRPDRAVLIFDPAVFKDPGALLEPRFSNRLKAGLGNRRVAVNLHGALYIQVSYTPLKPMERGLLMDRLDLSQQPGPFHLPIGTTKKGPLWLSLIEMDSVLVGGARRMGKTRLVHGFVQSLIRGGEAELCLWDGKNGVEFGRYAGHPRVNSLSGNGLAAGLTDLTSEMLHRQEVFRKSGAASLAEYKARSAQTLPLLVPVVDELALVPEAVQDTLAKLIALGGAFGIHPILATQRPDAENIQGLLKSNLSTRISMPVPDHQASKIILGRTGAEKLPKQAGRLLLVWEASLVEARTFQIELPAAASSGNRTPTVRLLTREEWELVAAALEHYNGWFKIRALAETTGQGRDAVNQLAVRWEQLGYLTPVMRNDSGYQLGRRVTEKLRRIAGLDGSGDRADQADQDLPIQQPSVLVWD